MRHVVISSAGRTHPGRRAINEDAILARDDLGIWAVADGMGGDRGGIWASATVVETLARLATQAVDQVDALDRALAAGNAEIVLAATRSGMTMGSTVAALLFDGQRISGIWVGDSRVYRRRRGRLDLLTHDHSLVQDLVDRGALTVEESRSHGLAHRLSRSVGVNVKLQPGSFGTSAEPEDMYLICSDGLSDIVTEMEIADRLSTADPSGAADALLRLALDRGAPDNVSAVVVRIALAPPG